MFRFVLLSQFFYAYGDIINEARMHVDPQFETRVAVEISIWLQLTVDLVEFDEFIISLPRFTTGEGENVPGSDIAFDDFIMTPSRIFRGQWEEGSFGDAASPYSSSYLLLQVREDQTVTALDTLYITIHESNDIKAACGYAEDFSSIQLTFDCDNIEDEDSVQPFLSIQEVGMGCGENLFNCSGHGTCDYCYSECECDDGYGDIVTIDNEVLKDVTCHTRSCPTGVSHNGIPTSSSSLSSVSTICSNQGICEPLNGKCECYAGFDGDACQRLSCPNHCSFNGICNQDGTCTCDDGFLGAVDCSIKSCELLDDCNDQGLCNGSSGECVCFRGWDGVDCSNQVTS